MEQMIEVNLSPRLVADYFIARDDERADPDVTQMRLDKLMYFAQASYLAETGIASSISPSSLLSTAPSFPRSTRNSVPSGAPPSR